MTTSMDKDFIPQEDGQQTAQSEAELARMLAERNRDLRELLGYREAEVEAEKREVARELHDTLGSSLTAFNMHLSLLQHELPNDDAVQKRLGQMKTLLISITEATRRLQVSLRPEKLDVFGLKVALGEYVLDFGRRTGIACRASLPDDELTLPESYDIALFRIMQEALDNIHRHAGATQVDLILDDSEDGVMLTIRDNGGGLADDHADGHGKHGLRGMRERAAYLGGTVTLGKGRDGAGTAITVLLPPHAGAETELG
jgi:signal transduction histidine kinase